MLGKRFKNQKELDNYFTANIEMSGKNGQILSDIKETFQLLTLY